MTIQQLNELGANTSEGLERCLGDEGFYLELIPDALETSRYKDLDEKIKAGDLAGGFEIAHTLRGVLGNLALTPLYEIMNEITELLRDNTEMDYSVLLAKMWGEQNKFAALL